MSGNDLEDSKPSSPTQSHPRATRKHTWDEWWQAAKTVKTDDFKNIERIPCARQSLVYGIAGGTAIGCTRYLTSNPFVASNWAVASFVLISTASWYRCRSFQESQRAQIQILRDQFAERAKKHALKQNSDSSSPSPESQNRK
ncbi:hypothetical protein CPB86DRAFT_743170 [Serendipita vermifera]|nr:hypothetical protein CPB86DRAFT_743170 [Serendipita vermifera]